MQNRWINWDTLGISASVICAIHCAILPIFLTSLPVFGVEILHNRIFEMGMIGLAAFVGLYALHHGWKKHHHKKTPLILFIIGMLFLISKEWLHNISIYLLIPAVIFILAAHILNYRLCRKANHCHAADCNHKGVF